MDTLSAFNDFLKNWFEPGSDELEAKISGYIRDNKPDIVSGLLESFAQACQRAYERQEKNSADAISYLSYSMLYINFLARKPLYMIETFNDKWFFSSSVSEHVYDPKWMTSRLYEFYGDALSKRRKYLGRIHPTMIEKAILTVLDRQANLLTRLAKETFESVDLEEIEEFRKLEKDEFKITIGKYRGAYKEIYKYRTDTGPSESHCLSTVCL
ncbi:MAG: hypothetical protein FWH57_05930 [Oscillospiraceae bacterium]|nr:hypothetical protein [Oscillospiraceae bacterium]